MSIEINKLTNGNIYIDGTSHVGKGEEITLPDIALKMVDHKGLGLIGEVELWSGGLEKMSAKIKWSCFYKSVYTKCVKPGKFPKFMVRGSLQTHNSEGIQGSVPYVVYFTGTPKKIPLGSFKQNDNVEFDMDLSCTYVKLEVNGEAIVEVDILANIYKVEGVDQLAGFKSDIGSA